MHDDSRIFRLVLKCLLAAALIAILVIAALRLLDLLILAFGASVIAVLLHALALWISRHSPLSEGWSLAVGLALMAALFAAGVWLFGARIHGQFSQLLDFLPASWDALRERVKDMPGGAQLVSSLQQSSSGDNLLSRLAGAALSLTTALSDLLILIFGAVFIAIRPGLYREGILQLVPNSRRPLIGEAMTEAGTGLRQWMVGQLISMGLVGVLTGVGLWIAGVPMALALGLIAGLTEIIPWLGPILAAIPILAVALAQDPQTGLLALGVMLAVQQGESNLIMPYVQKKAVSLPPALTVFGVVAGGLLFGPVGLIFAAPLLVVAYILVKRLYVEAVLHTPTEMPGDRFRGG